MGEDSLETMEGFHYLGDVISCGGVELAVRDRISCAWSKWRELIGEPAKKPQCFTREKIKGLLCICEACIAVCCGNLGTNRKTGKTASWL